MLIFQVVDGTLTIYTSFENVSYDHLPLRDGQKKLGQDLYEAGHIQCVKEVRKPGKTPEITGYCIRQASVTESAFRVTIQLDNDRKVTSLDCNCDGGPSSLCLCGTEKSEEKIIFSCSSESGPGIWKPVHENSFCDSSSGE